MSKQASRAPKRFSYESYHGDPDNLPPYSALNHRPEENPERDLGLSLDFYSRQGEKGLAKTLAKKWDMKSPQNVYRVVHRKRSFLERFAKQEMKNRREKLVSFIERLHQICSYVEPPPPIRVVTISHGPFGPNGEGCAGSVTMQEVLAPLRIGAKYWPKW